MRTAQVISFVMCLGLAVMATAGDLRVTCSPGLNVFVDGDFVGVSTPKHGGKYVTGLSAGKHTIMVKKAGFLPKKVTVTVGSSPLQIVIAVLSPSHNTDMKQPETTMFDVVGRPVGTIEVTSAPQRCIVEIAGRKIVKHEPIMIIPGIPVGDYDIRFESSEAVLSANVAVRADETSRIGADFPNNRVEVKADDSDEGGRGSKAKKGGSKAKRACIEYWIEVVRTSNPEVIEATRPNLEKMGFPVYHQKLITIRDDGVLPLYKLRVGPINLKGDAKRIESQMRNAGFTGVWMVPEECQ